VRLSVYSDATILGGAEHTLATLLRHLDERFEVGVVAVDATVGELLSAARPGARMTLVPPFSSPRAVGALARQTAAVREQRPDVVQVNRNWIWGGQAGIFAGLAARVPTIAVEHSQPMPAPSPSRRWRRLLLAKRLGALVTVGEATARSIEREIGLPDGFVRTIHNGIEEAPPCQSPNGEGAPTIGAIGRLSPEKGFDVLLRALARLPSARLLLIGEGPERPALEALASELGLGDRLQLLGWQPDPNEWFSRFDLLAVPSRMEASPPLVALEALMAAVPVVAAAAGSIPEAIVDDRTGVLVPVDDAAALADAIGSLLADPPRRRRLGQAGRERVLAGFTAARMAAGYESLYAELLEPEPARARRPARAAAPGPGA
jgi:glycosyltransferase involved in cell wall biosynthesis